MFLGSGGRFIEREGVRTLSIRGYPRALRYLILCFQNVCFSIVSGLEKKFHLKISDRLLYQSSRVFEKLFLKAFESVGVKRFLFVFLKRASTHESSTYSKELSYVSVL